MDDWFVQGLSFYCYRGWVGMEGLSASDIMNLAQGPRTPVATIFTCGTGDFNSGDDYTEAFLLAGNTATPGGAVAAMGFATLSTHTRYNNVVVGGYYSGLLEYDIPEVGGCLLQGKYELYRTLPSSEQGSAANFAYWGNLMGDPGTSQWAGIPTRLSSSIPASLGTGTNQLTLTVTSGGQPVEGVVVCLWQDLATDIQVRGLTDAAGRVTLPVSGLQAGTLHVTATHPRHVPLLSTVSIVAGSANPSLAAIDAGAGILPNGVAQPFSFTLANQGGAALTNISITPSLDPAYGSVASPALTLASLAPGASQVFSGLTVTPASGLADESTLPVMLNVATSQGTFTFLAALPVTAPMIAPSTVSYPAGSLEPGANATVRVILRNLGAIGAGNLSITAVAELPNMLNLPAGPLSLGTVAPDASATLNVAVGVEPGVNRGQPIPLRLDWTADGGLSGSVAVMVTVGAALGAGDPTGPDPYGYWAVDNSDNSPLAPDYAWYAISTPEGGSGTELPINDNGDEQDAGVWINLPFTFQYYGIDYTRMAVCSNGFVSFAEGGFGEWDFRNHVLPGPIGPDAMIAPMWDDHLTTGTNRGVWTWHDAANHAFVVSWYNLSTNTNNGGPNSFQLVLYDPAFHQTQTGDGPFKFQYATFNDNQSSGSDFPYCSVGFKDETSTRGLTLRHWTQQPSTCAAIAAGRAIYISTPTGPMEDHNPPSILVTAPGTVFTNEVVTAQASITDYSGIASATLRWRVDGGDWNTLPLGAVGNLYSAQIPGQGNGSLVEFQVDATDASEFANSASSAVYSYVVHTLVFADGFNGTSAFTHEAAEGLLDQWHLESARAYEGGQCWKFGGLDTLNYENSAGGALVSPLITIPADASSITASLQSWLRAESSSSFPDSCFDGGRIQWRLDGADWTNATATPGTTDWLRWTTATAALRSWLGYPCAMYSGNNDGWSSLVLQIPDGTRSVQLRWQFGTDTGVTREGWYLDDFRLTAILPAGQLPAVTDLSVVAANNQIQLSWSAVFGAQAYRVYESTSAYDGTLVLLGETTGTSWSLPQSGAQKFYKVTAVH